MGTFNIDCELNYLVISPSTFIFKIEAAHDHEQTVHWERLVTLPSIPLERSVDVLGTRTVKAGVQVGSFSIR